MDPEQLFLSRLVCIRQTILIFAQKLEFLAAQKTRCCQLEAGAVIDENGNVLLDEEGNPIIDPS